MPARRAHHFPSYIVANELVVTRQPDGHHIALLANNRLVELHHQPLDQDVQVGDVYLGVVQKLLPGLNAAFVDIGVGQDGFLHYLDLGPQIRTQLFYLYQRREKGDAAPSLDSLEALPDIDKSGTITDVLKVGQPIAVQVMKEAISTKGPRLSSQISFAGNYVILMPFGDGVSISRKIREGDARKRLKRWMHANKPPHMGFIARTASEEVEESALKADLDALMAKWNTLIGRLQSAKPPNKLLSEGARTQTLIRDLLAQGVDAVVTDDAQLQRELRDHLQAQQPDLANAVSLKQPKQGLFEAMGVNRHVKSAFGRTVSIGQGASLVIEHTEALHVVDVNSGRMRLDKADPEDNALRTNLEAAAEVARQLRLRDLGGIIVVDFIDMRQAENRRKVQDALKAEMAKDRARHTILPMSRFGLVEITRARVRPQMEVATEEVCPTCQGTGKIAASLDVAQQVEQNVDYLIRQSGIKPLKLRLHPFLATYFTKGVPSRRFNWWRKYRTWVRLQEDSSLGLLDVKYEDERGEAILLD